MRLGPKTNYTVKTSKNNKDTNYFRNVDLCSEQLLLVCGFVVCCVLTITVFALVERMVLHIAVL